jgi:TPR repeat protein
LTVALNFIWGNDGFPVNPRQARIWYKKAALNGNPEAMFNLGIMQVNGEGGKINLREGTGWIRKCAQSKKKHIYAETAPKLLSEVFSHGNYGIEKDTREADYWKGVSKRRKKLD